MTTTASQRLAEGGSYAFYPKAELIAAINEGMRLFALLTLGLEQTSTWNVTASTTFFRMLTIFSDWIVPLRISTAAGAKVRPTQLDGLNSLDDGWVKKTGTPTNYIEVGADLLGLYKQPSSGGTSLTVTYARAPVAVSADGDVPEFPQEYHPLFVNYGICRVRQVEGVQEFSKAIPLLREYLEGAAQYADKVRARNLGTGYDHVPMELSTFDMSSLLKIQRPHGTKTDMVTA